MKRIANLPSGSFDHKITASQFKIATYKPAGLIQSKSIKDDKCWPCGLLKKEWRGCWHHDRCANGIVCEAPWR